MREDPLEGQLRSPRADRRVLRNVGDGCGCNEEEVKLYREPRHDDYVKREREGSSEEKAGIVAAEPRVLPRDVASETCTLDRAFCLRFEKKSAVLLAYTGQAFITRVATMSQTGLEYTRALGLARWTRN